MFLRTDVSTVDPVSIVALWAVNAGLGMRIQSTTDTSQRSREVGKHKAQSDQRKSSGGADCGRGGAKRD